MTPTRVSRGSDRKVTSPGYCPWGTLVERAGDVGKNPHYCGEATSCRSIMIPIHDLLLVDFDSPLSFR